MAYKYYWLYRPLGPGSIPKQNLIEIQNFDQQTYIEYIDHDVWGYAVYSQELSESDIKNYELCDSRNRKYYKLEYIDSKRFNIDRGLFIDPQDSIRGKIKVKYFRTEDDVTTFVNNL